MCYIEAFVSFVTNNLPREHIWFARLLDLQNWITPILNPQTNRGKQLKALTQAKFYTESAVLATYRAFHNYLEQQERTYTTPDGMNVRAAMTQSLSRDYREHTQKHFATFDSLLRIIVSQERLQAVCGLDGDLNIGWISDGPIKFPFPYLETARRGTIFVPMPYGLYVNNKQPAVILRNGQICKTPGIFMRVPCLHQHEPSQGLRIIVAENSFRIASQLDNTVQLIIYNGAPSFTKERQNCRIDFQHPFIQSYCSELGEAGNTADEIAAILGKGVFFDLPTDTEKDQAAFQMALLEAMTEFGINEIPIEEEQTIEVADDAAASPPPMSEATTVFEASVIKPSDLYQRMVEEEWKTRRQVIVNACRQNTTEEKVGKRCKNSSKQPQRQAGLVGIESTRTQTNNQESTRIKQELQPGAIKYRTLARLIVQHLGKSSHNIRVTKRGSHFSIHLPGMGQTIVRPHAGRTDMSGFQAKTIIESIQDLLSQSIRPATDDRAA